jgi:hypothetical protein
MGDVLELFGVSEEPVIRVASESENNLQMLDCGHWNWFEGTRNEAARSEGFCCEGGRKKMVVSWINLRGQYVRPIPPHAHRTAEKERGPGFPGLCTDSAGYYIGGIYNDCRKSSDGRRCAVHGEELPDVPVDPEPVETQVKTSPNPALPSTGMSWKQRQLEAKRGKR